MSDQEAEKAWSRYSNDRFRDDGAAHDGFMAGRASRDAEVASAEENLDLLNRAQTALGELGRENAKLREQLAEAQHQLAVEKNVTHDRGNAKLKAKLAAAQATIENVRDWNEKYGTLTLGEILSAPSSTGGN
jgi:hypothetical protein